ncbi:MAG TPA: aminoacyl-tRNA hydrolase [Deltaproteobacteria bacterium]|nr:aminoacyl-tRNA hydrolase [SAR324 cluster bacterium]HHZ79139.1 aminoacyl-tRNA hydrolase [Candidatus Lambdaproteobacteria bacterium]HIN48622.1 aminoacyl-tRNA hydrolase [Deltaproteobacteria bacterium]
MKLVAGLGNPGKEYEGTPHNVGFQVVDLLLKQLGISGFQQKFKSQFLQTSVKGEACIFIKPQTFMNRSGLAVAECANFYKIPIENIVIISDDLDLPPGKARFRYGGGHGGHNGLRSIIDSLANNQFRRVRIGIGRPAGKRNVVGHVLGRWSKAEEKFALSVIYLVLTELMSFLETTKFENTSFSAPELA